MAAGHHTALAFGIGANPCAFGGSMRMLSGCRHPYNCATDVRVLPGSCNRHCRSTMLTEHDPVRRTFPSTGRRCCAVVEAAAIAIVVLGAALTLANVGGLLLKRPVGLRDLKNVWLWFAAWIVLALEFALAADIIRTAIAPSWQEIGQLAAIAAIRTALNYYLGKDIDAVRETTNTE